MRIPVFHAGLQRRLDFDTFATELGHVAFPLSLVAAALLLPAVFFWWSSTDIMCSS